MSWKPAGYTSVAPYLVVKDAHRLIAFLEQVFDAVETRKYLRDDGSVHHAEVRIDDTIVMLGESPSGEASTVILHVYVPDAMATWQRAIDAGAKPGREPVTRDNDPDRRGEFYDPAGNMWAVGTQVRAE